VSILSY